MNNMPKTARINRKGHLEIGGIDVLDLAAKFETPLYVIDEQDLRSRCRDYINSFKPYPKTKIVFASKALSNIAILRIIGQEGLGADVASGGELFTALKAGIKKDMIYFHGNNKPEKELEETISKGNSKIVVDNFNEIEIIKKICNRLRRKTSVLVRINPGIEAHTHEFIQTGKIDSKFGIAKEEVIDAVKQIIKSKRIEFLGLHAHIGSQIFETRPFAAEAEVLFGLAAEIQKETGKETKELNIGGGIGVAYLPDDNPPNITQYANLIISTVKQQCIKYGLNEPWIILEPGRSIVANAGITLYKVGPIKDIKNVRKYVMVDGGMSDNPRPILYDAKYDFVIANKARLPKNYKVTIAGRFCESGDVLGRDIMVQKAQTNDIMAVMCTGAYNYSMSSNYNRVLRPAMVLANNKKAKIIIKRETYQDLVRNDRG
ncbi:MAG: diaminopimelate decarboxylase [bacterium]